MSRALFFVAWLALSASPALAQQQPELPPGHPPTGAVGEPATPLAPPALPPGHPPTPPVQPPRQPTTGQALPPGHPPTAEPPPGTEPRPAPGHPPAPGQLPPGHPPAEQAGPGIAQQRVNQALRPPEAASARASMNVPAGSIRLRVVDPSGQPVPGATANLGIMQSMGDRSRTEATTGPDGVWMFEDLATGSGQAYRVNVIHDGATFSSTPFQLPMEQGYEVEITRLPTTRETTTVFFHLFRVISEMGNERMHVIHQTQLTNAGDATYVFPEDGIRVDLPPNALNFQFQAVMTDQEVEALPDTVGYRITGSLPPGTVQLAYAYDIELEGVELDIPVEIPLPFYQLQVISEAIPDLELSVNGLPAPQKLDVNGVVCEDSVSAQGCAWVTQLRRRPTEEPIDSFTMQLSGIPGPGPARWVALGISIAFLLGALLLMLLGGDPRKQNATAIERRRAALLAEAQLLEEELEAGEIGPQFRQKRHAAIVRELAALLFEVDAAKKKKAHPAR